MGCLLFIAQILVISSLQLGRERNFNLMTKNLMILGMGFLSYTILFSIWLVWNDAGRDWYLQTILYPRIWVEDMSTNYT